MDVMLVASENSEMPLSLVSTPLSHIPQQLYKRLFWEARAGVDKLPTQTLQEELRTMTYKEGNGCAKELTFLQKNLIC